MCIIIYMPKGKTVSDINLENAMENNPDGTGIMWKNADGTVDYTKGLFTLQEVKDILAGLGDGVERAVHMRIATSGAIQAACCHPFPITKDLKVMSRPTNDKHARSLVMHNGVINFCTPQGGLKAPYSDTMLFTRDFLSPLEAQLDKTAIQMLIEEATTSRLLVFRSGTLSPVVLGEWVEDEGIYYSNDTYKPYVYTKLTSNGTLTDYADYYYSGKYQHIAFALEARSENEAYEIMCDIIDELLENGCYPDYMEGEDTFFYQDHILTFDLHVCKLPTAKAVLGSYEYEILFDEKGEYTNDLY